MLFPVSTIKTFPFRRTQLLSIHRPLNISVVDIFLSKKFFQFSSPFQVSHSLKAIFTGFTWKRNIAVWADRTHWIYEAEWAYLVLWSDRARACDAGCCKAGITCSFFSGLDLVQQFSQLRFAHPIQNAPQSKTFYKWMPSSYLLYERKGYTIAIFISRLNSFPISYWLTVWPFKWRNWMARSSFHGNDHLRNEK